LRSGVGQVAHVSDVQHIEAAVGKRKRAARCAIGSDQVAQLAFAYDLPHDPSPSTAARSSAGDTVAVPRFITTTPPA